MAKVQAIPADELIRRVAGGDCDASSELFRRYRPAMLGFARRISHDSIIAEDATQDACFQAWRDAARFDAARGTVLRWLQVIVRGRTLDRLRARQIHSGRIQCGFDPDAVGSSQHPVDHALNLRARMRTVDAALDLLPEQEGRTIKLAYFEGLTHTEIATRLEVPLGTAKTQLRRGMQLLRTAVDDRPRRPFQLAERPRTTLPRVSCLSDVNVLVVDDESDTVKLTALVLKRAGASVVCAGSAAEALERLETVWPDVAVIDLGMPEADGYRVMAQVHLMRTRHVRPLPVVAFTAMASVRDREETRAAGFALHLAKPIGPARLVDAIASVAHGPSAV